MVLQRELNGDHAAASQVADDLQAASEAAVRFGNLDGAKLFRQIMEEIINLPNIRGRRNGQSVASHECFMVYISF